MNENGFEAGDVVRGSHELLESAPTTPRPNVTNENVFFRLSVGVGAQVVRVLSRTTQPAKINANGIEAGGYGIRPYNTTLNIMNKNEDYPVYP